MNTTTPAARDPSTTHRDASPADPRLGPSLRPGSPFDSQVKAFGYLPQPVADEPLDGYLEHLAHGMRTDPMNLRRHFGLPIRLALGGVGTLTATQVTGLTSALHLDEATLRGMTLQRYRKLGLVPQNQARGYPGGSWPRGRGARYCPECLRERDHRWRLAWYLQWTFACVRHQRILLSSCPSCDRPVRTSPMGHPRGFHTGLRNNAQRDCCCPVEGLSAATEHLTPPTPPQLLDPVLRTQALLEEVLEARITTIDSLGSERPTVAWLRDVATLVRLLVTRLDAQHAGPQLGQLLAAQPPLPETRPVGKDLLVPSTGARVPSMALMELWADHLRLPPDPSPAGRMRAATLSPVLTSLAATVAVHILANPSIEEARPRVAAFPTRGQASTGEFVTKYGTSWELAAVLRREEASARPGATLAVRLVASRFTADGRPRRPLPSHKVPASVWPGLLTLSPNPSRAGYQAAAASTALLAVGSEAGLPGVFTTLNLPTQLADHLKQDLADLLELQNPEPGGTFSQLLALHDFLCASEIPIDYARRRHTFAVPQRPSRRLARRVAEESGLRQSERLATFMGWFVFELLTGSDILFAPSHLDLLAGHRRAYASLRAHWHEAPPRTLLRMAERSLQINHLDEPIMWAPQRTAEGSYYAPLPAMDRQLAGWSARPRRGESRHLVAVDGRPLHEVLALAAQPENWSERRLRVDLARFHVVAETQTMSAAACLLDLSQHCVSDSVRRLEKRLGHQLFERSPRRLILTDPGRRLHRLLADSTIDSLTLGRKQ